MELLIMAEIELQLKTHFYRALFKQIYQGKCWLFRWCPQERKPYLMFEELLIIENGHEKHFPNTEMSDMYKTQNGVWIDIFYSKS